jgi:glycosyltransferase involved in cell wall biosynthesis
MNQVKIKGLVSVIIPTYNRADYILGSVNSVLAQSYADFELIIIDDGSTDATVDVVKTIKDSRVKYYRFDNSSSPGIARNRGIEKAQGQYLAFLDSDDTWAKDKLKKQVSFLEENPDYYLVYSKCYLSKDGKITGMSPKKMASGNIFEKLYLSFNFIPVLTVLMRNVAGSGRYFFNPGKDKNLFIGEDYDLWLTIAQKEKIGYINEPLAYYTIHSSNMSLDTRRVFLEWTHIADKHKGSVSKAVYLKKKFLLYKEIAYLRIIDIFRKAVPKKLYCKIKGIKDRGK